MSLKVYLTDDAQRWLWGFVHAVDTEIGGFGYCTAPEPGIVVVDQLHLAPQEVSGAGVDFTDDAMVYMIEKASSDGRLEDCRFSWHSHVNMGVYWSSTDEEGIRDYRQSGMPWLISLVANKKHEAKARLDIFDAPLIGHVTVDKNVDVIELRDNSIDDLIEAEIKEHVTERKFTPTKGSTKPGQNTTSGSADKSSQSSDDKGKELELRGPIAVDSTMEPQEFVLWQKFLAGEDMSAEEEKMFDAYVEGKYPSGQAEVVDGQAVVVA